MGRCHCVVPCCGKEGEHRKVGAAFLEFAFALGTCFTGSWSSIRIEDFFVYHGM